MQRYRLILEGIIEDDPDSEGGAFFTVIDPHPWEGEIHVRKVWLEEIAE